MARLKKVGKALIGADADSERELAEIPAGTVIDVRLVRKRSNKHHDYFMALCREAFKHWPELTDFQPDDEEHLRKWLECKAGHIDRQLIEFDGTTEDERKRAAEALELSFRAERKKSVYVWVRPYSKGLAIIRPRSIAFDRLDEKEFSALSQKVIQIVEEYVGVSVDELLPDSQAAQWARSMKHYDNAA